MHTNSKKCRSTCVLIASVIFLLTTTSVAVLASGKGHHHAEVEMSEHLQAMLAVKEVIPEEYQIMERTPILPDDESLQEGHKLFLQNCTVCHGEEGDGKGPAAAAMKTPPANFLDKKHSTIYGPGEKYWIIGHGTGKTGMPAFSQITPVERWHLVNYILRLQMESPEEQKKHGHN